MTRMNIPDVLLIEPRVFEDERGFFLKVLINKHLMKWLDAK